MEAAAPVGTRGAAARRERDEDSWDRQEPLGASGHPAAARAAGSGGGDGATHRGGRPPAPHRRQDGGGQPPPREPIWGEDYDYGSWDREETWAPAGGSSAAPQAPAQARRFTPARGPAPLQPRGAVVAEPRAVHGGAAPSVRGSMDGRAAGALQDGSREVGDRGGSSRFTAGPPLPRTPVQLRARADSRQAGRSEVEVAGYDDYDGEDDWPHDDEVTVVGEEPSPASYRNSRLNSARRGLDPASGRQLGFESQNIDPRAMAELANSGGALAVMSRKRARVESGEYYSAVDLRGLSIEMVEAILGSGRAQLLTLMSEDDYWAARCKRSKEAKAVADAGANAGFDPNHDAFKNLHRYSFTQKLELSGPLDPKKTSTLVYSVTLFYQDAPSDVSKSPAFQTLQTQATEMMVELKADISRVRVAGGTSQARSRTVFRP